MADPRRLREMLGFGYGAPSPAMDALTPFHAGVDPQYMPQDKVTASIESGPSPYIHRGIEAIAGLFAPSDRAAAETADKLNAVADFNLLQGAYDIGKGIGDAVQGGDKLSLAMSMIPGKVADDLVPAVKAAQKGIKAYHGTPHDFDKFSLDKIGTGEGAQAYGHGLYFAENEGIARSYRDNLTRPVDPDNFPLSDNSGHIPSWIANQIRQHPSGSEYHKEAARRSADLFDGRVKEAEEELLTSHQPWNVEGKIANLKELAANLRRVERGEVDINEPFAPKGHMYEVNINADPDAFLDWDKPLSEQGPAVKDAANKLLAERPMWTGTIDDPGNSGWAKMPGERFNHMLQEQRGRSNASDTLKKAGIPGIKYLDAGSRATSGGELLGVEKAADGYRAKVRVQNRGGVAMGGAPTDMFTTSKAYATEKEARDWAESQINKGSRNYVVFSDEIIDIVKKYGIAGALGAGLITQQMADQLQAQQGGGQS